jgi:hypothetical protein
MVCYVVRVGYIQRRAQRITVGIFHTPGTIHVVNDNSTTSQLYNYTRVTGERTISPLSEPFPQDCTTCLPGYPTEHCEYEKGYCVKLSDAKYAIVGTNGSFLYNSPQQLNTPCTPLYLHRLEDESYAIICRESSFDVLRFKDDGNPGLDGLSSYVGAGGILVEVVGHNSGHRQANLYHVELQPGYVSTREVKQGLDGFIAIPESCVADSVSFRPTFSLTGLFFLQCTTNSNGQAYFSCSATSENCQRLDLCASPLPSPPGSTGGNTFTTACGHTLTVYNTNDVSQYRSLSFDGSIASESTLDRNTRLIQAGNSQHLVSLDTFLKDDGSSAVVTLENTTNYSISKLIAPDVYAMACQSDSFYCIRLVNISSGQHLGPILGLTEEPRDILFESQEAPTTPSHDPPEIAVTTRYTSEPPSPTPTINSTVATDIATTSTTAGPNLPPTNPPTSRRKISLLAEAIIIATVVGGIIVIILVTILVIIFKCRASKRSQFSTFALRCARKYSTEEAGREQSNRSIRVCGPTNPNSSLASSQSSSTSSVTTVAIQVAGSQS